MRVCATPVIQPPPLLLETVEWLDFLEPNISQIATYARPAAKENTFVTEHGIDKSSSSQDIGCGTDMLELPDWLPLRL